VEVKQVAIPQGDGNLHPVPHRGRKEKEKGDPDRFSTSMEDA